MLVRALSQHDYGVFAIIFIVGGVSLTYIRAMAAVPATLFLPRGLGRRAERGFDVTFGSVGALIAAVIAAGVALAFWPMLHRGASRAVAPPRPPPPDPGTTTGLVLAPRIYPRPQPSI